MPVAYLLPVALGLAVYYFADEIVHARRFGPITDSTRSDEDADLAFRVVGLLLVGVGVSKLLQTFAPW